jgi:hypothetical protein
MTWGCLGCLGCLATCVVNGAGDTKIVWLRIDRLFCGMFFLLRHMYLS